MVRIRLSRIGRKNAPAYRIVVTDSKSKRDGRSIEIIGHYNPTEDPKRVVYKKDRYKYWLSVGAQPSLTVSKLVKGTYKYTPYDPSIKESKKEDIPVSDNQKKQVPETGKERKE